MKEGIEELETIYKNSSKVEIDKSKYQIDFSIAKRISILHRRVYETILNDYLR